MLRCTLPSVGVSTHVRFPLDGPPNSELSLLSRRAASLILYSKGSLEVYQWSTCLYDPALPEALAKTRDPSSDIPLARSDVDLRLHRLEYDEDVLARLDHISNRASDSPYVCGERRSNVYGAFKPCMRRPQFTAVEGETSGRPTGCDRSKVRGLLGLEQLPAL